MPGDRGAALQLDFQAAELLHSKNRPNAFRHEHCAVLQPVSLARDRRADRALACPSVCPHAVDRISVIGLMKTGTNVMHAAMQKLNRSAGTPFWKHSIAALSDVDLIRDSRCHFVICIRDPLSWLQSVRRNSYQYRWSGKLHESVSSESRIDPDGDYRDGRLQADKKDRQTMIQMWNNYCRAAMQLREHLPLQVTLFNFSDLIDKSAMKRFFRTLDIALTDQMYCDIFEKPQKSFDCNATLAAAKAHLEQAQTGWLDSEWDYLMKHVDFQAWKTFESLPTSLRRLS